MLTTITLIGFVLIGVYAYVFDPVERERLRKRIQGILDNSDNITINRIFITH